MTQIKNFMRDYDKGDSLDEIAQRYGKTRIYVKQYLKQYGYEFEPEKSTPGSAYWIDLSSKWDSICNYLRKFDGWENVKIVSFDHDKSK